MKYDSSRNDTIMGNDINVLVDYPNSSMFYVLCSMFYVLCSMFYVLCSSAVV